MNGLISTLINEIRQISGLAIERNKSAVDIFFLCKTGAMAGSPAHTPRKGRIYCMRKKPEVFSNRPYEVK